LKFDRPERIEDEESKGAEIRHLETAPQTEVAEKV
jgi:hypothetical protein